MPPGGTAQLRWFKRTVTGSTMPDTSSLLLFAAAATALVLIPGPNTIYIIARTAQQGLPAGMVSSLGVQIGTLFHVAAAALGISALLLSSAYAFAAIKYLGAAYLVYLGLRTLLARPEGGETPRKLNCRSLHGAFFEGVVVNVLNPKTALFFLAFLPQFLDPQRGSLGTQMMILGAILMVLGFLSDSLYAVATGSVGILLRNTKRFDRTRRHIGGLLYIALGAITAFAGSHARR